MTYRIIATIGDRREHVGRVCLGGVIGPDFGDRDNAELYAAVWAAANPGWEWRVVEHGQKN